MDRKLVHPKDGQQASSTTTGGAASSAKYPLRSSILQVKLVIEIKAFSVMLKGNNTKVGIQTASSISDGDKNYVWPVEKG